MKADVIYFVESVPKELDVACIVKRGVEERFGWRVHVASYKTPAPEMLRRATPKLLVIPTCYAADVSGLRKHLGLWPDAPFLNLAWEELWGRANLQWKHPRDVFAQRHVMHHVWGDFYKDFLTSHGVPPDHVVVNGHPGYRLYETPYRSYFPSKTELARRHRLDPSKRWILFPEQYGWAFYSDANLAARVKGGMDPATPAKMRDFCRASLKVVLDWCRQCAAAGGVEMIIRPRPTTQLSHFETVSRELLGGSLGRARLIKDGTVNEWILASDVVVSSFSSSLIEAAIAGKPAYMVAPVPMPDELWAIWYDQVDYVTTDREFLDACLTRSFADVRDQRLRRWAHRTLLAHGDPIDNLIRLIGDICDGRMGMPAPPVFEPATARPRRGVLDSLVRDSWTALQRFAGPNVSAGDQDSRIFGRRDVFRKTREWERVIGVAPV